MKNKNLEGQACKDTILQLLVLCRLSTISLLHHMTIGAPIGMALGVPWALLGMMNSLLGCTWLFPYIATIIVLLPS